MIRLKNRSIGTPRFRLTGNPLTNGLIAFISAESLKNVYGTIPTDINIYQRRYGKTLRSITTGSSMGAWMDFPALGTGPMTIFAVLENVGIYFTYDYVCGTYNGTSGYGLSIYHPASSSGVGLFAQSAFGDNFTGPITYLFPIDGKFHTLVATKSTSHYYKMYMDGVLVSGEQGVSVDMTQTRFAFSNIGYIQSFATGSYPYMAGLYNRELSHQEVIKLSLDPFTALNTNIYSAITDERIATIGPESLLALESGEQVTFGDTDIINPNALGTGHANDKFLAGDGTWKSLGTLDGSVGTILNRYNYGGF